MKRPLKTVPLKYTYLCDSRTFVFPASTMADLLKRVHEAGREAGRKEKAK